MRNAQYHSFVDAFGMEMTLENILFASMFLVSDIASEIYGKKTAKTTVYLGIATSVIFMIISQLVNTVLFNIAAFAGIHDAKTIVNIIISCYVIFVVTSLADTPFVYIARKIHEKQQNKTQVEA